MAYSSIFHSTAAFTAQGVTILAWAYAKLKVRHEVCQCRAA